MGPNGAGKTTLLRLLARARAPEEGVVEGPERVGSSWQNPYLSFYKPTVLDEVLEAVGVEGEAFRLLEEHGLAGMARASPFTLSMGQARVLSILLATLWRPEAVVVDEPTTGLGARERLSVASWLRRLGVPYVVATHDLDFALVASDWLVALDSGRVVVEGPTPEALPRAIDALGFPEPPLVRAAREAGLGLGEAASCIAGALLSTP